MNNLKKKIGFVSLGCDKNRVDLEKMMYKIAEAGLEVTADEKKANVVIINTCSFIKSARVESIAAILDAANLKKNGTLEKIIVTGCINEMQYSDLATSMPEVDAFVNIKDDDKIVSIIYNLYNYSGATNPCSNIGRMLTTPKHYAFLKIADGCNNFCSYCMIPYIRGRYRSEPQADMVAEAKRLVDNGTTEIILVAQDVTKYGSDRNDGTSIVTLIRELSKIDKLRWIRLLYCYPESLSDELIAEVRDNPKVCKYFDIPMQHIDDVVLKNMNRRNSYDKIVNLITKLRREIPDIAIRTTFILGFPGETRQQFDRLCQFVKDYKLDYVGFFTYSREEGSRAATFDHQVTEATKQRRLHTISELQYQVAMDNNSKAIGRVLDVVVDEIDGENAVCRSQYQNPESDNVILVKDNNMTIGQHYKVKITDYVDYDLIGERI